jgi:hypothetical protein
MTRTWQEIAAEAAKEKDSEKLIKLAAELDLALEERDKALHKPAHPSSDLPQKSRRSVSASQIHQVAGKCSV